MISLQKNKDKNFVILNFSDFQLDESKWKEGKTIQLFSELYNRVKPDLVTITGDLACCNDIPALSEMGKLLDSYCVPWAPVFGNHDHDGGIDKLDNTIEFLSTFKYFTYENGPSELGRGNYIINICEDDKVVHSLVMMDTHDRVPYTKPNGEETWAWAKLLPSQLKWYSEQIEAVKKLGSKESTLITHIPINAYIPAWWAAYNKEYRAEDILPSQSYDPKYWNKEYSDSFGVRYEGASAYPEDDGAFDAIKETNHTKNVLAGHSHTNSYSINYQGVRLTFVLKTTDGSYYNPELNGGTVITVNEAGKASVHHEYVDIYLK